MGKSKTRSHKSQSGGVTGMILFIRNNKQKYPALNTYLDLLETNYSDEYYRISNIIHKKFYDNIYLKEVEKLLFGLEYLFSKVCIDIIKTITNKIYIKRDETDKARLKRINEVFVLLLTNVDTFNEKIKERMDENNIPDRDITESSYNQFDSQELKEFVEDFRQSILNDDVDTDTATSNDMNVSDNIMTGGGCWPDNVPSGVIGIILGSIVWVICIKRKYKNTSTITKISNISSSINNGGKRRSASRKAVRKSRKQKSKTSKKLRSSKKRLS